LGQRAAVVLTRWGAVWRQPGRYRWLVSYLNSHGLQTRVRWLLVMATVIFGVLPVTMLHSPSGPRGRLTSTAVILVMIAVLGCALRWAWKWPTPRQAVGYVVITDVATAVICWSYADPLVGLVGCMIFATLGVHVAFFHSVPLQVFNVALGLIVATILGVRTLQDTGDVVVAVNVYVVVTVALIGISITTHMIVDVLDLDLRVADTDPLGGLLNRRAFYRGMSELLTRRGCPTGHQLCVSLIDLDRFKRLNDSRGHHVGDLALIAVSRLIDDLTAEGAVAARIGGEEFVIAEFAAPGDAEQKARALCAAIAATEFDITASIGLTTAQPPTPVPMPDNHPYIDDLIRTADTAMYAAKRAGGNQTRITSHTPHATREPYQSTTPNGE
jgi:diguanylate cyclase (GGDEF)-like protein